MAAYAQVLLIAIPFFIVLIIIESLYGWWVKKQMLRSFDTMSSLYSGITNTIKNVLGLTVVVVGYTWMHDHIALVHIEATWAIYLISFIAIDFAGYLGHLLQHHVNFFWNEHVVHHSSEEFNLPCALRQTISGIFSIQAFLLIPAALLGMPPKVIATIAPIHLFLQFWYHTRYIGKLAFLEYIFITPSQHRVHHAINPEYLDKNLGQIFTWWDRIFGTFQEEMDDVPCVYGTKKPAATWNPVLINFQHIWILIKDAWRTREWKAKFTLWFKPTGWRPEDVKEKYPIDVIDNPFSQVKYATEPSASLKAWAWFQHLITYAFLFQMLFFFTEIGFPALFAYGTFLMLHIYAASTLMDLNPNAIWTEGLKCLGGIGWIYLTRDWFGANSWSGVAPVAVGVYLMISFLAVAYFVRTDLTTKKRKLSLH